MDENSPSNHEISPGTRRVIIKWIIQSILGVIGYALIIFISAGTLDWVWGWVLVGLVFVFLLAHPLLLVPINPELLVERGKGLGDEGVKTWDRWVAGFAAGVMPLSSWIVAGLDVRFGWTGPVPLVYHLFGLLGSIAGYGLFLWAMISNAYFSEGVRIQDERGHTVATGGPYRFVRHPGYSGAILSQLSTPFLLGSIWSMIPSFGSAMLYILRTYLEDSTLTEELPGYLEYTQVTRFRLLPGIW
ncbi:MAG: methyltransferase family protein [Anaerolineales bacterium]|jgi:protein-S-isoprenylcysteine O-methyltransferase Ste14